MAPAATGLFCFFFLHSLLNSALIITSICLASNTFVVATNLCQAALDRKTCGNDTCLCCATNTIAHCSDSVRGIYGIPRLPETVRFLTFTKTGLTRIWPGSFENMPNVTKIDLSQNNLRYLDKRSFVRLTNLKRISFRSNAELSLNEVAKVLFTPSLQWLSVRGCNISLQGENAFQGISDTQLETFVLSDMFAIHGVLNLTQFNVFIHLKELDFSHDRIKSIESDCSIGLESLLLNNNPITVFLGTCMGEISLYPNLRTLSLSGTLIKNIDTKLCLPLLETLELIDTNILEIKQDMFAVKRFPNLQKLKLGFSVVGLRKFYLSIRNYAFRNSSLKDLAIENAQIRFTHNVKRSTGVEESAFAGCSNLTRLVLTKNVFRGMREARFHLLFGNLLSLDDLAINDCEWDRISPNTFAPFRQLSVLKLSKNNFPNVPDGSFDSLLHLKILDLSENKITAITKDTFSPALLDRLDFLWLDGNPFICTCELLWFSKYIASRGSTCSLGCDCINLRDTNVDNFLPSEQWCLINKVASVLIIFSCSSVIATLTLITLVFRFRWHIRLVLYEAFRGRGANHRRMRLQANHFDWDVFVSYASEDLPWVRQHLMPELEDRLGLRLCVHERDFIPGNNIVDNIVDCVASSKKISSPKTLCAANGVSLNWPCVCPTSWTTMTSSSSSVWMTSSRVG